jgi:hypothetical protein
LTRPVVVNPGQGDALPATRRRERVRRVLALTLYALSVLLFFEGTSRVFLREFLSRLDERDSLFWRVHWIRQSGRRERLYYPIDIHHPVRGWAVKPDVRDVPVFGAAGTVSSNSQGARGRREYAVPKPPGVTRVLVFGDSFTFGDEVGDDETYVARLEGLLPGVEVINLGVHGYGHDQMLLYLQEVGARYQPDLVLLGFVQLDMRRNLLAFRDFAKPRFVLVEDHLVLQNVPVPTPETVRARDVFHSRFLDLWNLLAERWERGKQATREQQLTGAILEEFRRTAVAVGAVPLFVYLPIEDEIGDPSVPAIEEEVFFTRWARKHNVRWLDLRPSFLAQVKTGVQFKRVGHWGPLEHATAAEAIRADLLEQRLISGGHPADPASSPTTTGQPVPPASSALVAGGAR